MRKYHLPLNRPPETDERTLTLCGRYARGHDFLWDGASDYIKEHFGCKSCLQSAGQKRQSHQGQEDHE